MLERLGQYRILERIGSDPAGDIYRARDTRAGRTVAVRVVPRQVADDPRQRGDLLARARASAAVSHPNIAALYEIGEEQEQLFLVFEYVPGQPLAEVIGGHPLNPRRALDYTIQLADALAFGHAGTVGHSGLSLQNVIITPKGRAKLLDFGLTTPAADTTADRQAAEQQDIFQLGCTLFSMLTGKPPSSVDGPLPSELDGVVRKMLESGSGPRYESAATVAAELRAVASTFDRRADEAARLNPLRSGAATRHPSPRRSRRRTALWVAVVVAVAGGALFVGASGVGGEWLSALRSWRHAVSGSGSGPGAP